MFERFTDRARQVVVLAQDEARTLRHNHIGTEHLLLGLLGEEEGLAARALESLNITIEEVRRQVERRVGRGDEVPSGQIPFTPRAKKVLELALREALSLGHNYIGTEHILLGVARESEGIAAQILRDRGVETAAIREEIIGLLSVPGRDDADWPWRRLAREIDGDEQSAKPTQEALALTFQQVADAISHAQGEAIAGQDVERASDLTRLRRLVLNTARWVEEVLDKSPAEADQADLS